MQKFLLLFLLSSGLLTNLQTAAQDSTKTAAQKRPDSTTRKPPDTTTARTLKTVTITGNKPPVERKLDKTIVNLDQNPTTEGGTVLDAMQHLPGVQVTPDGGISINGIRSEEHTSELQ